MKFMEIVNKLTGISCPIFGVSWHPSEAEVTAAKRIIAFLEDRRVLYQAAEMEMPNHCVQSVIEIRHFLTVEIGQLDPHSALAQNLIAMRAASRKFMDQTQTIQTERMYFPSIIQMGSYAAWVFCAALGEMRASFGWHIAIIAVRNGLDIEADLAAILPAEDTTDSDDQARYRLLGIR